MSLGFHKDSTAFMEGLVKHEENIDSSTLKDTDDWKSSQTSINSTQLSQKEEPIYESDDSASNSSTESLSGSSDDFDETYQSSYFDPYSSYDEYGNPKEEESIFCCISPWKQKTIEEKENVVKAFSGTDENNDLIDSRTNLSENSSVCDESEYRNESSGETIESEEKSDDSTSDEGKTNEPTVSKNNSPATPLLKGILKSNSVSKDESLMKRRSSYSSSSDESRSTVSRAAEQRRSLFVTPATPYDSYNDKNEGNADMKNKRRITFAPMAKVTTVPALADIPPFIRLAIWWTKHDYAEFKKTGRIIAKAMLEGGSQIWLSSRTLKKEAYLGGEDFGEKWWCKFGHSRRGLEHITRPDEGVFRARSVSNATQSVLREQRRQRLARSQDEKKLSIISMQYTSWARDLSLAVGHADAEAVRSDFSERESCPKVMTLRGKVMDGLRKNNFSAPPVSQDALEMVSKLDENTYTSILARFSDAGGLNGAHNALSNSESDKTSFDSHSSIAKKAAAFGREEGGADIVDLNSIVRSSGRTIDVQ